MNKRIKLIWDFRGIDASETAKHFEKHLKEFTLTENLDKDNTGCKNLSKLHSMAYMLVPEEAMSKVRDALHPHRGEYVEL